MNRQPVRILTVYLALHWCVVSSAASINDSNLRHGQFDVSHTGAQLVRLLALDDRSDALDPDETVSWSMYVPKSYNPEKPAGLIVYISPTESGQVQADWRQVLETENLIWISANSSGNKTPTKRRIFLASLAPYVAGASYGIDPGRVYLSGFSGGGKAAGIASIHLAQLFKGAIFICGAEIWRDISPTDFANAATNRYVFVTGTRDFNRVQVTRVHRRFGSVGLVNSRLIVVPGMDHRTPDSEYFREAVLYLDRRE